MISSDNLKVDTGKRIRDARTELHLTQKEFCVLTGMKLPSLKDYELGNSMPGGEALVDLGRAKINTNWLLTGVGEMFLSEDIHKLYAWGADDIGLGASSPANPVYAGDQVSIDKYVNVSGSAGPGSEVHEEAVVQVRVDVRLLRERVGSNFSNIKIASVSGDSMEPTLSHGDQVLVDTSCSRFIDDAIYAIQQDGHLRFKRIQLKLDGSIVVRSDGSTNIETYTAEEAARFFIVGLVIPFKFGRFKI